MLSRHQPRVDKNGWILHVKSKYFITYHALEKLTVSILFCSACLEIGMAKALQETDHQDSWYRSVCNYLVLLNQEKTRPHPLFVKFTIKF